MPLSTVIPTAAGHSRQAKQSWQVDSNVAPNTLDIQPHHFSESPQSNTASPLTKHRSTFAAPTSASQPPHRRRTLRLLKALRRRDQWTANSIDKETRRAQLREVNTIDKRYTHEAV